ncbi:MAG TPA: hypothetical protein VIS55_13685 [Pseudomonadales bacterium]
MRTRVQIEDGDVSITFEPESEVERLCITELGDEISVSRSHKNIVLRRRRDNVRKISDLEPVGQLAEESL